VRLQLRVVLAWALWLVTFGCCAAGLLVTLAIVRPLTLSVLAEGAIYAFFFVLGYATVGLVPAVRRPVNPIGSPRGPRCGCAACPDLGVPVVGGVGYALVRRRPAPDLRSGAHAAGSWR
jgi:hypothetical protein